jgi:dihydroflavonol-4-reductase
MRNILITGGCGFLGYYLVNSLLKEFPNCKIKIIDLKENPLKRFQIKNKRIQKVLGKNITKYNSIEKEFRKMDIVIHLAGLVSFSLKDKENIFKINVYGTKNVLKASVKNKVKKFVHISSVAALGFKDSKSEQVNEDFRFDWRIAERRNKYYMTSKHLADLEVKKFEGKINTLIIYPGLMYGPGDIKNSFKMINAIKERKIPFNMPGGTNIIDVRDVSRGIIASMKKSQGEYLLSGYNLTFKEINQIIAEETNSKPPKFTLPKILDSPVFRLLEIVEKIKSGSELTSDNIDSSFKFRYFTNEKAKKELSWEPKIPFEQTIKDTYSWMQDEIN